MAGSWHDGSGDYIHARLQMDRITRDDDRGPLVLVDTPLWYR